MKNIRLVLVSLLLLASALWLIPGTAMGASPDMVMAGKNAHVPAGTVHPGNIVVFGSDAVIEGHVRGDVVAIGGNIIMEEGAIINGSAVAIFGTVSRKPNTQVGQEQVSLGLPRGFGGLRIGSFRLNAGSFALGRLVTVLFLGLIFFWLLPLPAGKVAAAVDNDPLKSVLFGLLGYIALIPLSILLLITILGIPLIPVLWIAVFVARFLGQVALGVLAGKWLCKQLNLAVSDAVSLLLGLFSLGVLTFLPYVGGLASLFYGLLGFGAVLWTKFGTRTIYPIEEAR